MIDIPFFSIIVPVYNGECFIKRSLDSIFSLHKHGMFDFEVIVVNDGSDDGTSSVLDNYHGRIKRIDRNENKGLVYSVNEGIKLAEGKYIIRMDADDEFCSNALYMHREFILGNKADFTFSDRWDVFNVDKQRLERISVKDNYLSLIAIGIAFHKKIFDKLGLYEDMFWEEHDFLMRVINGGYKSSYIPIPLIKHHYHKFNMTLIKENRRQGWIELVQKWGSEKLFAFGYNHEMEEIICNMKESNQ